MVLCLGCIEVCFRFAYMSMLDCGWVNKMSQVKVDRSANSPIVLNFFYNNLKKLAFKR